MSKAKPQVTGDEEHQRVHERVAAVDAAMDTGMVCTRLSHLSRPGSGQASRNGPGCPGTGDAPVPRSPRRPLMATYLITEQILERNRAVAAAEAKAAREPENLTDEDLNVASR